MPKHTTRRAVLAGAAAAPALALPSAASPTEPDPIFTLIEEHKAAFDRWMVADRDDTSITELEIKARRAGDASADPAYAGWAASEACEATQEAFEDASYALLDSPPATLAGALALIEYVDKFNSGGFVYPAEPERGLDEWRSAMWRWPELPDENGLLDSRRFGFELLSATGRGLAGKAVAS